MTPLEAVARARLLLKADSRPGYQEINALGARNLDKVGFGLLRLESGQEFGDGPLDHEIAIVVLEGTCSFEAGKQRFEAVGVRKSVFSGPASAVHVPPGLPFGVVAETPFLAAICRGWSDNRGEATLISPEQVRRREVGKGNWYREVFDILDDRVPAARLLIGETINPPGNWSSYPPHKHEVDNLPIESKMQELYHFRIEPSQGFGIQRVYTDDRSLDETYTVEDGDTVLIPRGYHPVAATGGYRLYYLWVLAGEGRVLAPKDDPRHAWVKGV